MSADTRVAPLPGRTAAIDGRPTSKSGAVVKLLAKSASWFPARSVTPSVTTTAYSVSAASVRVSVTTVLSAEREIDGKTSRPSAKSVKVLEFTVPGSRGSEKVTEIGAVRLTSVAPSSGVTITTSGGVVSRASAVVKVPMAKTAALPARSWTVLFTRT